MKEDLIKQAANCLAIQEVYLRTSNFYLANNYEPLFSGEAMFNAQFKQRLTSFRTGTLHNEQFGERKIIQYFYECAFRLIPSELPPEVLETEEEAAKAVHAEVKALFAAFYAITNEISNDAIKEFGRYNVGYHVHPYWREYASSVATRMKLPPITIPMYKLPIYKDE